MEPNENNLNEPTPIEVYMSISNKNKDLGRNEDENGIETADETNISANN